jgi:hypothetical protein
VSTGRSARSRRPLPRTGWAALTYARRYALFPLVGIAGEDDLDAPDLPLGGGPLASPEPTRAGELNGHAVDPGRGSNGDGRRTPRRGPSRVTLEPAASAALRAQLIADLPGLTGIEDLNRWAKTGLPAKNTLTAEDARLVEQAFQGVLDGVGAKDAIPSASPVQAASPAGIRPETLETDRERIDKSVLALPEPRRRRNKDHLRFVAKQPCLICARQPCDAHHVRFAQSRGLSLKVSDEFTVGHHRELHRAGNEASWWRTKAVDAIGAARKLWNETHPIRLGRRLNGSRTATEGSKSDTLRVTTVSPGSSAVAAMRSASSFARMRPNAVQLVGRMARHARRRGQDGGPANWQGVRKGWIRRTCRAMYRSISPMLMTRSKR